MAFRYALASILVASSAIAPARLFAVSPGTAFTYQGSLNDGGAPANGLYDFQFSLYGDPVNNVLAAGPLTFDDLQVSNGLFTADLDFGSGIITGDALWLQVGLRPGASSGAFTLLPPRQKLTPTPYAQALALPYTGSAATAATGLVNLTQFGNGQGLSVGTSGLGTSLFSSISNNANPNSALAGTSNGSGNVIQGISTGTGRSGFFRINNTSNSSNALDAQTNGSGNALFAANSGAAGSTGVFQLTNPANNANAVEISANGTGDAVLAKQNGTIGVGVHGVTTQGGTAVVGEAQGNGVGVWGESNGAAAAVFARNNSSDAATALQVDRGSIKVTGAGVGTNTCVFIHRATAANLGTCAPDSTKCVTIINHPMTNGDPNAILIVTYNTSPPGVAFNSINKSQISVSYESGKWEIFNVDRSDIPVDTCFNVMVIKK